MNVRSAAAASPSEAALHERACALLAAGDAAAARTLLENLVAQAPGYVAFWLSLAATLRRLSCRDEELAALERALAADPTHLVVLLQKAALLDLMHKPRSAAAVYGHALQTLGAGERLPPAVEAHVRHARRRVADNAAQLAAVIDARLGGIAPRAAAAAARAADGHGDGAAPRAGAEAGAEEGDASQRRFDRCLDRLLGRRRIYQPEPTFMLFPFLRNEEFFARGRFPWLAALEAATPAIREELLGVLGADEAGIQPYIAFEPGLPLRQWQTLNHSRRWSAYFLWNQGRSVAEHAARCPRTVALLESLPQVDIPGRGPTAFFSFLDAHTAIPPHSGVTNTRLTVHLPLVVPPGCRFRVGGETRDWREGTAWVFDDTIEHEAWNDSDASRAILIFDVWNPELTALERDLVRETTVALAQYYATEGTVPGVVF